MVRVEEIPLFFHQFGIHTDIGDDSQAAEDISLKKGSSFFIWFYIKTRSII